MKNVVGVHKIIFATCNPHTVAVAVVYIVYNNSAFTIKTQVNAKVSFNGPKLWFF
jgi:hypothetical protein